MNKKYIIKSISLPDEEETIKLLFDLKQRAKIDGWSFSKLTLSALREYLIHHPIPNPQATLDRSLALGMRLKSSSQCCVGDCRRKARMHLILKNYKGETEVFPVCKEHKHWHHPKFKFLQGVKPI